METSGLQLERALTKMDFNNIRVQPPQEFCAFCGSKTAQPYETYINGQVVCSERCKRLFCEFETLSNYSDTLSKTKKLFIPPLFEDTDVERIQSQCDVYKWKSNFESKKQLSFVKDILTWQYSSTGLLIFGESGAGKSRILFKLLENIIEREIVKIHKFPERFILVFEGGRMKTEFERSYRQNKSADLFVSFCSEIKYLIIDDFAKEKFTDAYESALFQILDRRTSRKRPTVITTNYVGDTLKQKMFDQTNYLPLIRRLKEFSVIYSMNLKK